MVTINVKYLKLKRCAVIGSILLLWEFLSRFKILNPTVVPSFSKVLIAIVELFNKQNLIGHVGISLYRSLFGFFIAIIIAIPLGIVISISVKEMEECIELLLDTFSQINPFIVYHLIIIILGVGEKTQITVITWTCIWPILFNTITGVRNIDSSCIKYGKSFGMNKWNYIKKILIPGALPQIMYGAKMSLAYSLFMLIAAEMMGCSSGLGYLITMSQGIYRISWVIAIVVVIATLGVLMDLAFEFVKNKITCLKYKSN